MKSLNFQKLNLRTEDILSKTQMKNVLGGYGGGTGGCCAHTTGWGSYECGYANAAEAQSAASEAAIIYGVRTWYCCDCGSSPGYPGN